MFNKLYAQLSCPSHDDKGRTAACIAFGLMAIYLLFLPVGQVIAIRNIAFFSLVFITLWSHKRYGLRLHLPLATPWLIYGTIALLSLTYAVDPLFSLGELKKEIGYGMLILMLTATWIRDTDLLERFITLVIASNIFQILAVAFKITAINPVWHLPFAEIGLALYKGADRQLYNGVGNLSTYLITVIPLITAYTFLRPHRVTRIALAILLTLDITALFLTSNRAGLITLVAETLVAVFFLVIRAKKKGNPFWHIFAIAVAILTIISTLTLTAMQTRVPANQIAPTVEETQAHMLKNDVRWRIWSWAIADIRAKPLTGGGFGRTVMCLRDPKFCQTFNLQHAHNMVLNKGIQMGLPGIAAFLLLMGMTLRALWPRRTLYQNPHLWIYSIAATTMFAGVFLKNMTDDFFVNNNGFLFWALVGAILGTIAGNKKTAEIHDT
jgi:O-antigen ligase